MNNTLCPTKHFHIGVILYEGCVALDFMGPLQYFELLPNFTDINLQITTIGLEKGCVRGGKNPAMGIPFIINKSIEECEQMHFDLLLVPGGWGRIKVQQNATFLHFIKSKTSQAKIVMSVCTGAAILATIGVLDGKKATTNKIDIVQIAPQFPQVEWIMKARWVIDGNVWTSSGITAGMDMAHAFIKQFFGQKVAQEIAELMEMVVTTEDSTKDPFAYLTERPWHAN
jgi:transcriptional regulator GlxA family with amidase domain